METKYNGDIVISKDYIITTPPITTESTESVGSIVFKFMKIYKDNIAQIYAETGESETYGVLLQRCIRTALHMSDKDINRSHVVTLCTHNHLNAIVPHVATQFLGAQMAALDPGLPLNELTYLLNVVRPKILFMIPEMVTTFETILKDISLDSEIVVFGPSTDHTEFEEFLRPHQNENEFEPVHIDNIKDTALIHFSSGTTGMPKGICINHYTITNQLNEMIPSFKFNSQSEQTKRGYSPQSPQIFLSFSYLYWASASALFYGAVVSGNARLVCAKFDTKEFWNVVAKFKPVYITLNGFQAGELARNIPEQTNTDGVFIVMTMGSRVSKEQLKTLQKAFPKALVSQAYGQTEVYGALALFSPRNKLHRELIQRGKALESVGLPVAGKTYRVVDLDTNKNLGPNQRGELRVKTEFIFNGYYNEDSSDNFDEEGWLKTGDIVYYDEDYCFYVVDRIKEAFRCRGWFIAPTMIEFEMLKHPAVKQAVVVGVPKDDDLHPLGVVVLKDGFQATELEIEQFVEARVLERQRLTAGVKFVKSLPLTVTGKVKRGEVKRMAVNGQLDSM